VVRGREGLHGREGTTGREKKRESVRERERVRRGGEGGRETIADMARRVIARARALIPIFMPAS